MHTILAKNSIEITMKQRHDEVDTESSFLEKSKPLVYQFIISI